MRDASTASRPQTACRRYFRFAAFALALPLAACGGVPPDTYDLAAAKPQLTRPFSARLRIAEPLVTTDLDSDRILVRAGPQQMARLAGAKWPERLPFLVQARLVESFRNAGLGLQVSLDPAAPADYELELDRRQFELNVARARVEVVVAAKLLSAKGSIVAAQNFTADAPVASTETANVVAAMNGALASVLKRLVAFAATRL
jgi:cholesterol transport system auxiliary component